MSDQFEHVSTPIQVGPVTMRNRICFSAHGSSLAEDTLPTQRKMRGLL